ncbi:hydrolase [Streptomyces sp. SP18ES09]|uniref:alpha/beta hydrolase family protein n=1 Tax=Streptomyces sp. SP18ES09 TaxID=3002532 RepID=UPI002E78C786|nr:hydrolase [Streptomyces sp. SP18ES09]MEE1820519.1 hydrolase [Streptomyces sp. SP18ES09]
MPPTRRALLGTLGAAALTTVAAAPAPRTAAPDPGARPAAPAGGRGPAPAPGTPVPLRLPPPTGPWPVGTVALHLVDDSRPDPLLPTKPYRELMAGLWYPAELCAGQPTAPWLPEAAAADWDAHSAPALGVPAGAADWRGIRTHARTGAPVARRAGRLPVVLFSSGDGGSRALGTTLVEELASRGHLVVALDSTYEAEQVEFPGGRVERALPLPDDLTPEVIAALLAGHSRARLADARFVLGALDRLARGHRPDTGTDPLPEGLAEAADPSRTGVLGQSLGGSVAAQLAHDEPRVRAAADLDGALLGPVADSGLAKPFLLMASGTKTLRGEPSWASCWAASTGPRHALRLRDAAHGSYTDVQVLLPQLVRCLPIPDAAGLIGTVDPRRSLAAQRTAVAAFFGRYLTGRPTGFLDRPGDDWPELEVLR